MSSLTYWGGVHLRGSKKRQERQKLIKRKGEGLEMGHSR